jgi:hypothetical protein
MFTYVSLLRPKIFIVGPLGFQVVDLVIQMFMCQRGKNCISTIVLYKSHKVVWDFPCSKNNVNNKSFMAPIWDKTPMFFQTLIPIMQQNISQKHMDAPIHMSSKES